MGQEVPIGNMDARPAPGPASGMARLVTLVASDAAALLGSGFAAHALWALAEPGHRPGHLWQLLALVPLFTLAYAAAGLFPGSVSPRSRCCATRSGRRPSSFSWS